jgi:hypothetical protein
MIVLQSPGGSPKGCGKLAGRITPGNRRRVPSRPEGALDSSFWSFKSFVSLRIHSAIRPILPRHRQAEAGYPDFWILDSEVFPWCFSGAWSLAFGCFPTPNSTLELGNRPLIWGKNGLSHPQFNALARSKNLQKPSKIRAKSQPPATYQPPQTKKLIAPVELRLIEQCRRQSGGLPEMSPRASRDMKGYLRLFNVKTIKNHFGGGTTDGGAAARARGTALPGRNCNSWPFVKLVSKNSNLLQPSKGISNLLKHPPGGEGGRGLPRRSVAKARHAKSRQIQPNRAKSNLFQKKKIVYFLCVPQINLNQPIGLAGISIRDHSRNSRLNSVSIRGLLRFAEKNFVS